MLFRSVIEIKGRLLFVTHVPGGNRRIPFVGGSAATAAAIAIRSSVTPSHLTPYSEALTIPEIMWPDGAAASAGTSKANGRSARTQRTTPTSILWTVRR